MILQVFFAVLEYVTDTLATPLTQPTRRWFRPWWLGNVKSMMHPVYQKWWYCWCLFCVVMSFRFLWLCWYHREKISWFSFGNETKCKNFVTSCVSKMMISPTFVLCGCVFQIFMAVLVSSRGDFFGLNENERTMVTSKRKIFDKSCVSKMMILLWCLFCVVLSFRFSWLCWCHREEAV